MQGGCQRGFAYPSQPLKCLGGGCLQLTGTDYATLPSGYSYGLVDQGLCLVETKGQACNELKAQPRYVHDIIQRHPGPMEMFPLGLPMHPRSCQREQMGVPITK